MNMYYIRKYVSKYVSKYNMLSVIVACMLFYNVRLSSFHQRT